MDITDSQTTDDEDAFPNGSRRVGVHFSIYRLTNPVSSFRPQAYREDNPLFAETALLSSEANEPYRPHRPIVFEKDVSQNTYSYDFVGLGGGSGSGSGLPHHTASQYRETLEPANSALPTSQRPQRGILNTAYLSDHMLNPQKTFSEYRAGPTPETAGSRKSRYYHFKSSRSPRVVFPTNDDTGTASAPSGSGATGIGVYFNDNVVFRDQNFGLNDLAVIQDVRNEFSLQDLDSSSDSNVPQSTAYQSATTFKEKGRHFICYTMHDDKR